MTITVIETNQAPKAIGPYSQGVISMGFLYTSGQIPLIPATGEMVKGGFRDQVEQVFKNLEAILVKGGCGFKDVIKATVFLTSMDNFPVLNEVYTTYLGQQKPARSTLAVAGLPKGAQVEIELIARLSAK